MTIAINWKSKVQRMIEKYINAIESIISNYLKCINSNCVIILIGIKIANWIRISVNKMRYSGKIDRHFLVCRQTRNMTPYQKFQRIFEKWLRFCSHSIGYNILDKNFKIGIHTSITVLLVISILVLCIYTMCAFDAETSWKGASVLSVALQVNYLKCLLLLSFNDKNCTFF